MISTTVYRAGALFSIMALAHFAFDWLLQSDREAQTKSTNALTRALHCVLYAVLMESTFYWLDRSLSVWTRCLILVILLVSHFVEDTYKPVIWWMQNVRQVEPDKGNPLHLILMITVDQIIHLAFVLLCCYLVVP